MNIGFYPKLAWTGIQKNRKLYLPYLLTCAGMVSMHYIISFLSDGENLQGIAGAGTIQGMMQLGSYIIALFAAFFLLYTNSFLIRRRQKEFGLYNILGMSKWNIGLVLIWETLITAALSMSTGLIIGVAFSKVAELGLVNIMKGDVSYRLSLSRSGITITLPIFGAIFILILLRSLWQLGKTNAIALLHSENTGEKPPKGNWIIGLLGAVVLAAAYWIAATIQDPLSALLWFFAAAGMVILATYMLFQTGSVLLCRILQRNKRYYYKANHFVSISSMAYRMKRNGAGLASICILLTMVLVMISATSCMYFGTEDALMTRYPRAISVDVYSDSVEDADFQPVRNFVAQVTADHGAVPENIVDYRMATINGMLVGNELETDYRKLQTDSANVYGNMRIVHFVPLEDYNRMAGEHKTLAVNEVLVYAFRDPYTEDTFAIRSGSSFRVKEQLSDFPVTGDAASNIVSSMFVVVPDFARALEPMMDMRDANGNMMLEIHWRYAFDLNVDDKAQVIIYRDLYDRTPFKEDENLKHLHAFYFESRAVNRDDFYGTFGGLFFLGLMLSIVFLFAAVLIIYYKQISEGYEDQGRFEIMQKVGMAKRDIRRSINSQMLTVFFLPLVFAGLHLVFAFPMIRKLLMLFNMVNVHLFIITTLICFAMFSLFYALVYKLTSNVYYHIVSEARER